jgi:putative membrane protein
MGSADIVPGVSGGTIALITGIYERLIYSISKINFKFIKPLFKLDFKGFWRELLDEIDFAFFIPLVLGIGIAMLTVAKVVTYCMDFYPALTYSFFLGLIIASAYILLKKIPKLQIKHVAFVILGFVLAYIFVSLNPIATNHSLPVIFISGLIAICAMILPGISGSFLLLLLGQYEYMLTALHELHFTELIVFIVGAIIGILGFSKLLNYLLKKYEELTMAFLIGVMLGTLKIPALTVVENVSLNLTGLLPCIIVAVIAFVLIIVLETRFTSK